MLRNVTFNIIFNILFGFIHNNNYILNKLNQIKFINCNNGKNV
jgi:hypothetical protein